MSTMGPQDRILNYLRSTNASKTTTQISTAAQTPAHEAARILLSLRDTGTIEKTASGWRAKGQVLNQEWKRAEKKTTTLDGRDGNRTSPAACIESHSRSTPSSLADDQQREVDTNSRWATFRRLCLYYAECVRLEERASVSGYAEKEGSEFLTLGGPIDWRTLSSAQQISISADPQWDGFFRSMRSRSRFTTLYVGTPLDVFVGKSKTDDEEYRIASPVFVMPVLASMNSGSLNLQATSLVEINHGWLERKIKHSGKRKEFLEQIGLTPTTLIDDEQQEACTVAGFDEAVRALYAIRKEWWREFPDLAHLSSDPSLAAISDSGLFNRCVLMRQPALKYAKRLYDELHVLAFGISDEQLDKSALRFFFPHMRNDQSDAFMSTQDPGGIAEYCILNEMQRKAVELSLSDDLVVATGPPGTGKSVVVAHSLANLACQNRSAVFASRNHQALEAVEPRLNALTEPESLVLRPNRPFGQQAAQFEWHQAMTSLLARPRRDGVLEETEEARRDLRSTIDERTNIESQMAESLDLEERLAKAERTLQAKTDECPSEWDRAVRNAHSLPSLQATQNLHRAIQELQGFPRVWFLRPFIAVKQFFRRRSTERTLSAYIEEAHDLTTQLPALRICNQLDDLDTLSSRLESLVGVLSLADANAAYADITSKILLLPSRADNQNRLRKNRAALESQTLQAIRLIAETAGASISGEERQLFAQLRAAMHNRPEEINDASLQSEVARAFTKTIPELLRHFPIWAVSNLSVSKALPLVAGSFDLLIVDEASQCDIASVVPLLFRARRAMIVGDPNQLPHVTRLSRDTDMRVRQGLDVADFSLERYTFAANSMFDLAASSSDASTITLRNHYRCHPDIANYCNNAFYNKTLNVMTDLEALRTRLGRLGKDPSCVWHDVPGDAIGASSGCYSPNQIEAIVKSLRDLEKDEFSGSIGVVTPFRAQATRIRDAIHQQLPAEQIRSWRLIVDTADGFQGDERDLVFLSLVGSDDMPRGSAYFLRGTPNRFNVAVSRARALLRVYGDEAWAKSCGIPFISELQRCCSRANMDSKPVRRDDLIGPVWEPRFADALCTAGLPFEQQYPACGYYLDFALFRPDRRIAVEIDGETYHRAPGGGRKLDDIYRDLVLEGAGWQVIRFWVYQLRENLDECIKRVRSEYERDAG